MVQSGPVSLNQKNSPSRFDDPFPLADCRLGIWKGPNEMARIGNALDLDSIPALLSADVTPISHDPLIPAVRQCWCLQSPTTEFLRSYRAALRPGHLLETRVDVPT